uniref:Aminotransferase-like plant mobile domain-containing protein n=1 Tax=Fagus sylvatica TaxID=28930 RepID=A0A2N9HNN4_FAGSY
MKVCMNRSSDERVMAPGSRGIGAVFVHFSGEDSDQTGDAFGEPRVPRRSWSRYLSNAPGLVDQLVASRKDSAREGGYFDVLGTVGKLALPTFARFRLPMSDFGNLGIVGKLVLPIFQRYRPCTEASLGSQDMILRTEAVGMFLMPRGHLLTEIPASTGGALDDPKVAREWSGSGQFDSAFGLVNSQVKPWSNLVNLGRIWSKLSKLWEMYPGPRFEGFWARWTLVGLGTARSNLGQTSVNPGQTWSTLVKLGQPWSNLGKCVPDLLLRTPIDDQFSPIRPTDPAWKFIQTIGENWDLTLSRIAIGWSDPAWKFIQTIGENWDLTLSQIAIGWSDPAWKFIQTIGENWDLTLSRIAIGWSDLAWKFIQTIGENWDLRLMSDRGSGSGGHRRSDRLAKGKSVIYAPESPPDTDDEYDAMEDVRTRVDASLARDLQAEFDAEAAGLSSSTARPSSRPGITIGRSARPSSAPRQPTAAPPAAPPARSKRRKSDRAPLSADPIPEDHVVPGFRYPPQGGIRPRYPVTTPVVDTPLLTNLHNHPSSSVRRCQDPPESIGRGGWSEFSQLLDIARPEYRDFLVELGFGPFLSIRYVHVRHPLVRCWVERFFHHTGTIHLSTCEVGVLPVDWSAILGIRFGGRIPPSDPVSDFEALEILGIDDPAAIVGKKLFYLKISYLKDLLVREIEEPPTELRYRQWTAYFIFSCFLGNDKSTIPTPIVGMFRDIDDLRDYDWGALTYGFYIRGLRRFSRRETASFLGFWQFTLFWAFEHFAVFAPSRLPAAPDSAFPLARRWDSAWIQRLTTRTLMECRTTVDCIRDVDIVFQPYSTFLLERPEVFRAMELSRLRIWIRSPRSWELLMGERTLRQLGGDALVPVDPPQLMTIEDYIPRAPSDSFVAGVEAYPALILADVPYREWFEQVSLGSLMSLHEVEGGRVMGGSAMDSHLYRSSGEFEWLQTEILRLQLELSVSEDRYAADMARAQEETARVQAELTQVQGELTRTQGDFDPESEGFGFSGCGADCPCGDHSETRGSASWHGHYSCYWSWLVWSWSDFFFAAPRSCFSRVVL